MKMGKKLSVAVLGLIACVCMAIGLAACGPKLEALEVTSVSPATTTVFVGESTTLRANTNRPLEGEEVITWTSDKTNIATVANGKVTGVAEGEATITASYGETSATCKVTVQLKKEITLDKNSVVLYVGGDTVTVTATCTKGGAVDTSATVTWSSSDETAVTVKDGVLTAVASDEAVRNAVITADYDGNKATCTVKIINDDSDYTLTRGNANATILADPGTWFYFDKTTGDITVYEGTNCERTHDENGEILTCKFDKIEIPEGKDPEKQELYLRYMPDLENGTQYKISFSFVSNTAGRLEIGDYKAEFAANESIDFYAIQSVGSYPLNVKFFVVGENVEFVLSKVVITTDFTPDAPDAE